jgi:hypothetical protein
MPKSKPSGLHQILASLRLLIVLVGAAAGLAFGNPWHVLAIRLVLLWASLYILFALFEVLLQFLSAKATAKVIQSANLPREQNPSNSRDTLTK